MYNYFLFNVGAEDVCAEGAKPMLQNVDGQLYTLDVYKNKGRNVFETATHERDVVIKTYHKDKPSMVRSIWDKSRVEW
jgi:hypothetical protein